MEPLLSPGDRVAVDTKQKAPTPPGVFCLWDGLGILIKRLEYMPEKKLVRVSSANDAYATYDQELADISIQGRVVWAGRQI
jgi:phage repressor protein C with HTH and peptisase S24 domain